MDWDIVDMVSWTRRRGPKRLSMFPEVNSLAYHEIGHFENEDLEMSINQFGIL